MSRLFDITVPDDLAAAVEAERERRGLAGDRACVVELLTEALAQRELEARLVAALDDEERPRADDDWEPGAD